MDHIELFATWYPNHRMKNYLSAKAATVLRQKDRNELYLALTDEQQRLFDQHRKYRMRSFLLKTNYLEAANWSFVDLRVNPYFPQPMIDGTKLVCECGRPLKYQFVLQSYDGSREICLGVNHFADHLHLPLEVAREIQKGVNEVDIALDQLLLLKKRGQPFPEALWQRYCFSLFRTIQLKEPVLPNQKLFQRVYEFRKVGLPIYPADFQLLEQEIAKIDQRVRLEEATTHFHLKQTVFEQFVEDIERDLEGRGWMIHTPFFTKKIKAYLHVPVLSASARDQLFAQVLETLLEGQFTNTSDGMLKEDFAQWLQASYQRYGWTPNFFYCLPRGIRNGLLKARRLQIERREQVINDCFEQTADVYLQHLVWLSQEPSVHEHPVLFNKMCATIFPTIATGIEPEAWLAAVKKMQAGEPFAQAFKQFSTPFGQILQNFYANDKIEG